LGFRCAACDGPDARLDAGRRTALCTSCERAGPTPRDPLRLGDILTATGDALTFVARTATTLADAPKRGRTICRECGAPAEWYRTTGGRWMLMEPGAQTAGSVPPGRRWRVAGDGTAVGLRGAAPSDTCRVSHFDVCPARSAPPNATALLALWQRNARQRA
jgi:hypothetical protein